jgi:acyl carrier protein
MQLLKEGGVNLSRLDKVKVLLLGGEPLPESIYNEVSSKLTARIFNVYGPTETTVWSTVKEMTDKGKITIGKPIANTRIYIINNYNKLQPIGAVGELCIAGDGLAKGYLNKPELTNEKFIPEYCDETYKAFYEQSMYRTGDLARWLSNGELEHLGRVDHQVKVRGHRIELGEIESSMSSCKNIKDSVVAVKTNTETNSQYLVGYYISEAEVTVSEIRNHLLKHLPGYMIPEAFVQLKEFPQTPNGKTDRNALPDPDYSRPKLEVEFREADTILEKKLVDIWKYILKRDAIGINDSFFELGGNSMLLVALSERLEKEYPDKVSVSDLFNYSTISKLSAYLEAEEQNDWKNIDMCPVPLPKEYFICSSDMLDNYSVLKFDIPMTVYEKVKASADNCSVEVFDILLAMYIYLLGEISQTYKD